MNCPEYLDWMQQELDGVELPHRAALKEHLAGCADCRRWFAAAQLLRVGLREQPTPRVPELLADRVVAAALRRRRIMRLGRWIGVGAAAAGIVIALSISLPGGRQPTPEPRTQAPNPRPARTQEEPPHLGQSVQEARTVVAAWTDEVATQAKAQAQRIWPKKNVFDPGFRAEIAELKQPLEPTVQSLRESGRELSNGLAMLGGSARRAVNYFLRELPTLPGDRKTGL